MRKSFALFAFCVVLAPLAALAAPHAKPLYGAWGFDATGEDKAVRPGDDFFRYANGAWLDRTTIPADKPTYTLRVEMSDRTLSQLHDIMDRAAKTSAPEPTSLAGKVGAFYTAFMDTAQIAKLGVEPIEVNLNAVHAAKTREALAALMGRNNLDFDGTIFGAYIDVDLKDPKKYAVYLHQAGLGLPDRDYYLEPAFAATKAKYQAYIAQLLKLAGWPEADARAKDVVAFETEIARASWTKTQQRDPVATYNPMSADDLQKFTPGFDWTGYLRSAGLGDVKRLIVGEKSAFPRLASVFAKTPLETLQAWQAFNILDNTAFYLPKPFEDAWFDMHDKTLSGQTEQRARWKRAVLAVGGDDYLVGDRVGTFGNMGWGVGQLYTAKYFPPETKTKIEQLVANLKAAYRARIEKLDWMSPSTRKEALKKLDTYTIKVGYPDHPRDYSNLMIRADDLIGDVRRSGAADWHFYVARLNGPVDRTDWIMTPQTNDAYNGSLRDIVFPAGILQAPVFDPNADSAINYGGAGGIIGHELTHGFDDQGRKIDAEGRLRDWWAPRDAKIFEARAAMLGKQYSAYEPLPGVHVQGDLTMGENIADLGGVTLAVDAYRLSLHGKPAPVLHGVAGDQRVFLGWAQAWRGKVRDDFVRKQVVSDPHSPRQFRVNGPMRNVDAWYAAFDVKPGEKLYLPPSARVHIW